MSDRFQKLRLRQLDRKMDPFVESGVGHRPKGGWLRAIREALGMTTRQLAERVGVSQSSVSQYEQREVEDRLTLATLRKVADGLNCDVVYTLVPREGGLTDALRRRAEEVARRRVENVNQTMRLESQEISQDEKERRVRELAAELLNGNPKRLWEEK